MGRGADEQLAVALRVLLDPAEEGVQRGRELLPGGSAGSTRTRAASSAACCSSVATKNACLLGK